MFDENDNLIITDPVSFSVPHKGKRSFLEGNEGFLTDPEELLEEVARVMQINLIAKCVARHVAKQPEHWKQKRSRNNRFVRRSKRRFKDKCHRAQLKALEARIDR
ncbi:putative phage-related protein [Pectobacterium atrosepticum SCRI1043]|uniref:Phage-related protein n=1 Tax=Pectobacterium atrosepticum (strain SCRI 1043 / ATCC BAA-672) TaxID=218491 RepID=Q6D4T3_PECAS|nr:phage-like protein [Pectobacterium atrosepticum]MCL6315700.1 hypothetical protein [Pectobacterium atrosepticum]MCL6320064.1 hypothetical protein [Pectobacterium atrosepticum]CAG75210.1 putative phage-related protein [Pectobacterium atrosepticum SCRI1043]